MPIFLFFPFAEFLLPGYHCIRTICGSVKSFCFFSLRSINCPQPSYRLPGAATSVDSSWIYGNFGFFNVLRGIRIVRIRRTGLSKNLETIKQKTIRGFLSTSLPPAGFLHYDNKPEFWENYFFLDFFSLGGLGGFSFLSFGLASPFVPNPPMRAPPPIISSAMTTRPAIIIQPI